MTNGAPILKYRSKGRIFADILRTVQEGGRVRITHILYKANLSHDRLTKYLEQLREAGLVETTVEEDKTTYIITPGGDKFLMEFRRMEEFADAFGLEI
jgi:predicted transcriptional regulator